MDNLNRLDKYTMANFGEPEEPEDKAVGVVDLIASGYEWTCPLCQNMWVEQAVVDTAECVVCDATFDVADHYHAYQ